MPDEGNCDLQHKAGTAAEERTDGPLFRGDRCLASWTNASGISELRGAGASPPLSDISPLQLLVRHWLWKALRRCGSTRCRQYFWHGIGAEARCEDGFFSTGCWVGQSPIDLACEHGLSGWARFRQ